MTEEKNGCSNVIDAETGEVISFFTWILWNKWYRNKMEEPEKEEIDE